jgi:Tol biopolymer transport system component
VEANPSTGHDIWVFLKEEGKRVEFACTEFNELWPEFSPLGGWLAYGSDETGRPEVYLQSYPPTGGKIPISTQGGSNPAWSRDGRELFYLTREGLWAVDINIGSDISIGKRRHILGREPIEYSSGSPSRTYDVSLDNQRFLLRKQISGGWGNPITEINIVFNWFEELKRLVPSGK